MRCQLASMLFVRISTPFPRRRVGRGRTEMTELPGEFTEVPCPGCGSDLRTVRHIGRDPSLVPGLSFKIVACDVCGLHYTSPRPVDSVMGRYYPDDYHCYQRAKRDPAGAPGSV